ncbi:galactose oxidase [Gigaspora margarita]|uniref:Galactose oxidase n=1 Tax=Gigaspora margarita TaxID=4874 RepID=A0A8H4AFW4_GIGMA|nr:galactose oxidase [Gigaspora margarita]
MLTTNSKDVFFLLSTVFILSQNFLNGHSFKPEPRGGHMATLVNDRIYFFGGSRPIPITSPAWNQTHQYNLSDEVFYLDLSSSFTVNLPPFTDLSAISRMPFGCERGTTVLGYSGVRIFLVGGVQQNMVTFGYNTTNSSLWIYNINSQKWDTNGPGTYGPPLPRRRSTATVIDKNGVIYIFGGRVGVDTGSDVFIMFDDLFTLDTSLFEWSNLSLPNHPPKRNLCTATLMPDGKIIYIGGVTQSFAGGPPTRVNMNEIYIFDTIASAWSQKSALGNIDPRVGHTAILAPDNYTIVIFGGTQGYVLRQSTSYPTFVLLDVKSEPFQYSSPQTSGMAPPPLSYHTATLYQNYMIVVFGNITNDFGPSNNASADIYIMNLLNYTWVTQFETASSSHTNNIKLITIIFSVIGSVGVSIGIGTIIYFKYYRRKFNKINRKKDVIELEQSQDTEQPH